MAAGTALRDSIRTLLGHRGAFFYKMQAGMGDTVFGPFYEVLHRRGVRFEFFSCVTEVRPDADGTLIEEIDVVDQVGIPGGEYHPLYDVLGLPCWPNEPLWEQLEDGEALKERKPQPDFEHVADPLGRGTTTLRRGEHFDEVVLAFPPDVQRTVVRRRCAARTPRYAAMLDATKTVVTQAFQLWFTEDAARGPALAVRRRLDLRLVRRAARHLVLDVAADPARDVPAGHGRRDGLLLRRDAGQADQGLDAGRASWRSTTRGGSWPRTPRRCGRERRSRTARSTGPCSSTSQGRTGPERLDAQYWRANPQPEERYVLSVAGSILSAAVARRLALREPRARRRLDPQRARRRLHRGLGDLGHPRRARAHRRTGATSPASAAG